MSTRALSGYAVPCTISDYYLVGLFAFSEMAQGPKQWKFPSDLLLENNVVQQIKLILGNFDKNNPVDSWELIKLKIQAISQCATRYCQKQARCEINSLRQTLKKINSKIYDGDNLDKDHKLIEMCLEHCLDKCKFFLEAENKNDWVCIEGKPNKKFLHLEDTKLLDSMLCLKDKEGREIKSTEGILKILFEFYQDLYLMNELSPSSSEMVGFLTKIPSLPKITFDLSALG